MGEVSFLVGRDHNGKLLAKFHINEFNRLVWHSIAVHVLQGVLEDGTRHGHREVVGRLNTDFNGLWQKNFLAVG